MPTRAWELGLGALVALDLMPKVSMRRARNALAILGLSLIAIAIVVIDSGHLFPAP
ncbi:hypothetical protein AB5I41_28045 [Sphingomonas sp. MMS24-JH45]